MNLLNGSLSQTLYTLTFSAKAKQMGIALSDKDAQGAGGAAAKTDAANNVDLDHLKEAGSTTTELSDDQQ